jgi:hypothetical protein
MTSTERHGGDEECRQVRQATLDLALHLVAEEAEKAGAPLDERERKKVRNYLKAIAAYYRDNTRKASLAATSSLLTEPANEIAELLREIERRYARAHRDFRKLVLANEKLACSFPDSLWNRLGERLGGHAGQFQDLISGYAELFEKLAEVAKGDRGRGRNFYVRAQFELPVWRLVLNCADLLDRVAIDSVKGTVGGPLHQLAEHIHRYAFESDLGSGVERYVKHLPRLLRRERELERKIVKLQEEGRHPLAHDTGGELHSLRITELGRQLGNPIRYLLYGEPGNRLDYLHHFEEQDREMNRL